MLFSELTLFNLNLPARVFLPMTAQEQPRSQAKAGDHHVVRIPPQESVLLNSKEKAPYLMYVEVVDCDDGQTSLLPQKGGRARVRHTRHASIDSSSLEHTYEEDIGQDFPAVAAAAPEPLIAAAEIRRRLSLANQAC